MTAVARPVVAPASRILVAHVLAQLRIFVREPISWMTLALPLVLFTFFGVANATAEYAPGVTVGAYMLASLGAYGVSSVMVFNFGLLIATERAQRWDALLRVSPLRPAVYLLARSVVALAFGVLVLAALFAYAYAVGVRMDAASWAEMALGLFVGAIPFLALGFALGYAFNPQVAAAVANIVYLVLAFASGMFVPLRQMPEFIRAAAPFLPTYHYAELAWGAIGFASESTLTSVAWLVAYTVALFAAAVWAYQREAAGRLR